MSHNVCTISKSAKSLDIIVPSGLSLRIKISDTADRQARVIAPDPMTAGHLTKTTQTH